jgi:hypothetical protein
VVFKTSRLGVNDRQALTLGDFNGDDSVDLIWSEEGDSFTGVACVILGPLEGTDTCDDAHGWLTRGQAADDTCDEADTRTPESRPQRTAHLDLGAPRRDPHGLGPW